jgi:hypothetical protein
LPLRLLAACVFRKCVLNLNPEIIFVFASMKADITPKKRAKIIALNDNTSITVRETMLLLLAWENRVCQEFFVNTRIPDHFLQTEKENAEENEKPLLVLISFY